MDLNMELTQLQYFRTVARIQNITRAAKALHISQPALSRAISRLEEELDASLFERSGNRITLSPSGVAFLNRVDQIFNSGTCINTQIIDKKRGKRHHIVGKWLLP